MTKVRVEIDMDGLIEVANRANESICQQIAREIAGRVPGAVVDTSPRSSVEGYARTNVGVPLAQKEAWNGALARALGGA